MRTVDSAYVQMLYDYLNLRGVNSERLLGRLIDFGGRVPVSDWKKMLIDARQIADDSLFGLRVAERLRISHFGYLGYMLLKSESLLECFTLSKGNTHLVSENNPTQVEFVDGLVDIHVPQIHGWVSQESDEVGLGATLNFIRLLTKRDVQIARIDFVGPTPSNTSAYEAYFGSEVRFGCEMPRILLPMEVLFFPKLAGAPEEYQGMDAWVGGRLQSAQPLTPEVQSIRIQLLQLIRQGKTHLSDLADLNCCSIRTMQRTLELRGIKFKELLNSTRHWLAMEYLRDGRIALSEIAQLLGYSGQAAFNRAFSEWTGATPTAMRNAAVSAP